MPANDPTTAYARMSVWALARAHEMFGYTYPCDGDSKTFDSGEDDQPEATP